MEEKSRRGIQSFEVGTQLLVELARRVKPLTLKEVAQAAGMSTSKAHPYLVSFLKVGFVTQASSGAYELGPLALQLGLARLQRLDAVKEATPFIVELAEATEQSIAVSVWGNLGPTIVQLEEPIHPLHVNLRTGTVMSLAYTATGRIFAAYMPPKVVERLVNEDVARMGGRSAGTVLLSPSQVEEAIQETRKQGLARALGQPIPGISAFCAPVFDANGHLALGITAMGPEATFDPAWDGRVATPLRDCARKISRALGHVD
jgi:DNA-binding IclR family transcriptional regulator